MFERLKRWFKPEVAPVCEVFFPKELPRVSKAPRPWTGEGSLTEINILHHLQYGAMTRRQLDDVLDTQTAVIHLPKLVERGKVSVDRTSRPYLYEITNSGLALIAHKRA